MMSSHSMRPRRQSFREVSSTRPFPSFLPFSRRDVDAWSHLLNPTFRCQDLRIRLRRAYTRRTHAELDDPSLIPLSWLSQRNGCRSEPTFLILLLHQSYLGADTLSVSISQVRISIDYWTDSRPNQKRAFRKTRELVLALPLAVNVQDIFREEW